MAISDVQVPELQKAAQEGKGCDVLRGMAGLSFEQTMKVMIDIAAANAKQRAGDSSLPIVTFDSSANQNSNAANIDLSRAPGMRQVPTRIVRTTIQFKGDNLLPAGSKTYECTDIALPAAQ